MANPLKADATGSGGPMEPGETRTILDPKSSRSWTVHRTTRPYVFDLCDAYNAAMDPAVRARGAEWFVLPSGELKLGDNSQWSRHNRQQAERTLETERARYLRHQLEDHRGAAE